MDRRNFFKKAGQFSLAAGSTLLLPNAIKSALATDTIDWADAANGATASATSSNGSGFPAAAVTYRPYYSSHAWNAGYCWASGAAPSVTATQAVTVTFAGMANLQKIIVYSVQDVYNATSPPGDAGTGTAYVLQDFTVQAWDGVNWNVVGTVTGNNLCKRTIQFVKNINTDKIRIVISKVPTGQLACVVAIRAMGTAYTNGGSTYSVITTHGGYTTGYNAGFTYANANTFAAALSTTAAEYTLPPTISVVHNVRPLSEILNQDSFGSTGYNGDPWNTGIGDMGWSVYNSGDLFLPVNANGDPINLVGQTLTDAIQATGNAQTVSDNLTQFAVNATAAGATMVTQPLGTPWGLGAFGFAGLAFIGSLQLGIVANGSPLGSLPGNGDNFLPVLINP